MSDAQHTAWGRLGHLPRGVFVPLGTALLLALSQGALFSGCEAPRKTRPGADPAKGGATQVVKKVGQVRQAPAPRDAERECRVEALALAELEAPDPARRQRLVRELDTWAEQASRQGKTDLALLLARAAQGIEPGAERRARLLDALIVAGRTREARAVLKIELAQASGSATRKATRILFELERQEKASPPAGDALAELPLETNYGRRRAGQALARLEEASGETPGLSLLAFPPEASAAAILTHDGRRHGIRIPWYRADSEADAPPSGPAMLMDLVTGRVRWIRRDIAGSHRALDPQSRRLAASDGEVVKVHEVSTGRVVQRIRVRQSFEKHLDIVALALGPGGQRAAVGLANGAVVAYDVDAGKALHLWKDLRDLDETGVRELGFSPAGQHVWVHHRNGSPGRLTIFDLRSGRRLRSTGPVEAFGLAASPLGELLSLVTADHELVVEELASGAQRLRVASPALGKGVHLLSPDGGHVAWVGAPTTVALFDTAKGLRRELPLVKGGELPRFLTAAFSPDSRHLLAHGDREQVVYEVVSGRVAHVLRAPLRGVGPILLENGGRHALALGYASAAPGYAGATPGRVDLQTGKWSPWPTAGLARAIHRLGLAKDGRRLIVAASGPGLGVFDLEAHRDPLSILGGPQAVAAAADAELGAAVPDSIKAQWPTSTQRDYERRLGCASRSADGSRVLTGRNLLSGIPVATVWEVRDGQRIADLTLGLESASAVALDARGAFAAVGGSQGWLKPSFVHLVEVASRAQRFRLGPLAHRPTALSFAPNGGLLAAGCERGALVAWNTGDGRALGSRPGHEGHVTALLFHPTRPILFSAGTDGAVKLWTLPGLELLATLTITDAGEWVLSTPDGYFDLSAGARPLVGWRLGEATYPHSLAWERHQVPGLLGRLLGGDVAFRLAALRRLAGLPRRGDLPIPRPMAPEALKAVVPPPSFTQIKRLLAGVKDLVTPRIWGRGTAAGPHRYATVVEGVDGPTNLLSFVLLLMEHRLGEWRLVGALTLPLTRRVALEEGKRHSGASIAVNDLDGDGKPEALVKATYEARTETSGAGDLRHTDAFVVGLDGEEPKLAFAGNLHVTVLSTRPVELGRSRGELTFPDLNQDGFADLLIRRTELVEVLQGPAGVRRVPKIRDEAHHWDPRTDTYVRAP